MLRTEHLFPFLKLIRAMGAKDLLQRLSKAWQEAKAKTDNSGVEDAEAVATVTEKIGLDVVAMLLEKVPDAENEFFAFLSVYTGKSRDELNKLSFQELIDILKQLVEEGNFGSFFQSAVGSPEE